MSEAETLEAARLLRRPIVDRSGLDALDLEDAYAVQRAVVDLRLGRGETGTGAKLGFTSVAKMQQMGVSEVIVGRLTSGMTVADGDEIAISSFIHPRIEPEIAFLLGEDVDPEAPPEALQRSVVAVAPALEIIDSRFAGFEFSLPAVIADNTSAAAYAIGPWCEPVDLANLAVTLTHDGAPSAHGSTAAILGHPVRVLGHLARIASREGIRLQAGQVVLAGAATPAMPMLAGAHECRVAGLGRVVVRAVGGTDE